MNRQNPTTLRRESGQTLVVALIIMGVLLLVGFAFLGVVSRNVRTSQRTKERSIANDLAEAGIRYAHAQLLHSELGADWRGSRVAMTASAGQPNYTQDPDALYLRPASGLVFPGTNNIKDLGGPDGLGFYTRVNYQSGRALVRVRFAPSDANVFSSSPVGAIRNPGAARNYTIIESIGREGAVLANDPTTVPPSRSVKFQGYSNVSDLQSSLTAMNLNEALIPTSRKLRAFASIGIIESARFISNKDKTTRPADLGIPTNLGVGYGSVSDVGSILPAYIGASSTLINPATGSPTLQPMPGNGSIYVNGALRLFGDLHVSLNQQFGESIIASDTISAGDSGAKLTLHTTKLSGGTFVSGSQVAPSIDSRSGFDTMHGLLRDGMATTDGSGYPRSGGYKTPPSIEAKDPDTGTLRYTQMTRNSGSLVQRTESGQTVTENSGLYGHGSGVYVNNPWDRQIGADETGRIDAGSSQSLVYDWLNPNNGQANSGWKGPYYYPVGAYMELSSDGFTITKDGTDDQRYWRAANGDYPTDSSGQAIQTSRIRYRIGGVLVNGRYVPYIINSFTAGVNIDDRSPDFSKGVPFNGVVAFEGNVRVRGVIPTDVQMTVVSYASIYIEGNITKGVVGNLVSDPSGSNLGRRLNRASRSMLMLAASDYVVVNPTMFVGPASTAGLETAPADNGSPENVQISAAKTQTIGLVTDLPLDPSSGANPSSWLPYAASYTESGSTTTSIPTRLVLTHAMASGAAAATFMSLNVNPSYADTSTSTPSTYYFPLTSTGALSGSSQSIFATNTVSNYNVTATNGLFPIYGLGGEAFQRDPQFETVAFPVVDPTGVDSAQALTGLLTNTSSTSVGSFSLFSQNAEYASDARRNVSTNELVLRPNSVSGEPSNDYMLARAALVPGDVRIEASIYAENGSFFVIPGNWFCVNGSDTRTAYEADVTSVGRQQADLNRLNKFGSTPITPFYGEPIDVRIQVIGAISENMPPPIGQQGEWQRKWSWIPREIGALHDYTTDRAITVPTSHLLSDYESSNSGSPIIPNLTVMYDNSLATARLNGYVNTNDPNDSSSPAIRTDDYGRVLPPMPRLPVSPTLAYFGEVK